MRVEDPVPAEIPEEIVGNLLANARVLGGEKVHVDVTLERTDGTASS